MAEMTVAPVATHGFFLDGKWLEEGDIVDVRAPYDGALIGHVYQGRREHAEAAIAAAVKALERHGGCLPSSASAFCARLRPASTIAKKNSRAPSHWKRANPSRALAGKSTALSSPSTSPLKKRCAAMANICRWTGSSRPRDAGASSSVFRWVRLRELRRLIFR